MIVCLYERDAFTQLDRRNRYEHLLVGEEGAGGVSGRMER
jgi:hypothetical protein